MVIFFAAFVMVLLLSIGNYIHRQNEKDRRHYVETHPGQRNYE